jgi:hypothetical protein
MPRSKERTDHQEPSQLHELDLRIAVIREKVLPPLLINCLVETHQAVQARLSDPSITTPTGYNIEHSSELVSLNGQHIAYTLDHLAVNHPEFTKIRIWCASDGTTDYLALGGNIVSVRYSLDGVRRVTDDMERDISLDDPRGVELDVQILDFLASTFNIKLDAIDEIARDFGQFIDNKIQARKIIVSLVHGLAQKIDSNLDRMKAIADPATSESEIYSVKMNPKLRRAATKFLDTMGVSQINRKKLRGASIALGLGDGSLPPIIFSHGKYTIAAAVISDRGDRLKVYSGEATEFPIARVDQIEAAQDFLREYSAFIDRLIAPTS